MPAAKDVENKLRNIAAEDAIQSLGREAPQFDWYGIYIYIYMNIINTNDAMHSCLAVLVHHSALHVMQWFCCNTYKSNRRPLKISMLTIIITGNRLTTLKCRCGVSLRERTVSGKECRKRDVRYTLPRSSHWCLVPII